MSRFFRARTLAVMIAFVAAGCQDYNFNPVGHCMLQPGTQQFTLSNISSADVLFVVDDSGSMAGKQAALAAAFDDFVSNLTSTNAGRAQAGLLPLDFHIAVTTTSVYYNRETSTEFCKSASACNGVPSGKLACCVGGTAVVGPRKCTNVGVVDTCTGGLTCRATCNGFKGEATCCKADNSFPDFTTDPTGGDVVTCSIENLECGTLQSHYPTGSAFTAQCPAATQGIALDGLPFPDGAFVGSTSVSAVKANPRVLHFDKRLYLAGDGKNAQGFTMDQLKTFFRQNVSVGTCGSAQEQGLQAARRALERALTYTAKMDTYAYSPAAGLSASGAINGTPVFSVVNGIPAPGAVAEWPNRTSASKLVLVWVGDEDDCSAPKDPSGGVVLMNGDTSGNDACVRDGDASTPPPLGGKEYDVGSQYVSYFTGIGRGLGAAFVVSARSASDPTTCSGDSCVASLGNCCDFSCSATCPPPTGGVCGGQSPGTRFIDASQKLKAKGADVVVGSVCSDFGPTLNQVAEIVKPPQTLSLPTLPAESAITILRIADGTGTTRKICGRPLVPRQPAYSMPEAQATGKDWWFTEKADPGPPFDPTGSSSVAVPTKFVYINPQGSCIANPGETYSADYLGMVPPQGCKRVAGDVSGGQVRGSADCKEKLGGQFADWECYYPPGTDPLNPSDVGTCTCRSGG
jgi:hypothetical protein